MVSEYKREALKYFNFRIPIFVTLLSSFFFPDVYIFPLSTLLIHEVLFQASTFKLFNNSERQHHNTGRENGECVCVINLAKKK